MAHDVLVAGASGFIGRPLCRALIESGYRVRAMTRHPDSYDGAGEPIFGDVGEPDSLAKALKDVDAAYYLVHSLDSADFAARDAAAARAFGQAGTAAGLERIVYLGGLGRDDDELSPHLRSRREVESLLAQAGTPVTVLRAAVVIGHGGISWEITRQLVDRLPLMLAPRWVNTRTQPIALIDVLAYLLGVLETSAARGKIFDVGGPEVLRYVQMMKRVAVIQNKRLLPVLTIPLLTPGLSSRWLEFMTDVDYQTARTLIDSMTTEVVVGEQSIAEIVPRSLLGYDDSVRQALADRAADHRG